MKRIIPLLALAALFLISCSEKNAAQDSSSLRGSKFIYIDNLSRVTTEYYLRFDYPRYGIVTEYEEYPNEKPGIESVPTEWKYSIDGSLIKLENDDNGYRTRYATYQDNKVYYISRAYQRVIQ